MTIHTVPSTNAKLNNIDDQKRVLQEQLRKLEARQRQLKSLANKFSDITYAVDAEGGSSYMTGNISSASDDVYKHFFFDPKTSQFRWCWMVAVRIGNEKVFVRSKDHSSSSSREVIELANQAILAEQKRLKQSRAAQPKVTERDPENSSDLS